MPRKQRFKPSRKPKPVLQTEDTEIGRQGNSAAAIHDNLAAPENRDSDSHPESSSDQLAH